MAQGISWTPAVSPGDVPTYANGVEVAFSQWDFTFTLSHLFGVGVPEGEQVITMTKYPVARHVMSPQHSKAFLSVLRQHVSAYEERFGIIPDFIQDQQNQEEQS